MTVDQAITYATGSLLLMFILAYGMLACIVGADVIATRRRRKKMEDALRDHEDTH